MCSKKLDASIPNFWKSYVPDITTDTNFIMIGLLPQHTPHMILVMTGSTDTIIVCTILTRQCGTRSGFTLVHATLLIGS